jgi:hypothetical protein
VIDETDVPIGYASYYDGDGNPVFDGDYRALDGGVKDGEVAGETESRRYIDSSYSDVLIHSLCDEQVRQVDAVLFTNHLITGKLGAAEINGCVVSRDEAIIYDGSLFINYDIRTRHGNYAFLEIDLPQEPARWTVYWSD